MFNTINPATGSTHASYTLHTEKEALQIASKVHSSSSNWRTVSFAERKKLFKKLASVLRTNKKIYAKMMTEEMGKVITESLAEIEKCAWLAEVLAEKGAQWLAEEKIEADGKEHLITYEPLGTVYLVMPWNYPFWQPMKVGLLPLFAGNTILLKHAKNVTGSALLIERMFIDAGFPDDVFRTVIINHSVSDKLIASDKIQAVSFTGSVGAGSHIASVAAANIKKTVLELGGSDPFIVLEDADIEAAAQAAVKGRMSNSGQVCIGAKRFIVHQNVADEFISRFTTYLNELTVGDPLDPKTDIGPLVDQKALQDMEGFMQDVTKKKATIVCGGSSKMSDGYYFTPTAVVQKKEKLRISQEEVFGPIAPIIIMKDDEEIIQEANRSEFGLSASIWTKNRARGKKMAKRIDAGGVFINHISVSHPLLPLGGIKKSGYGRELSQIGIKEFTNIKPINIY